MPQGPFIRRRGRSTTFDFQLFEIDGVDFRVDAAHASGDTKIMKDEGAEANTANGFTDEGQGYSIVASDAEMQTERGVIYVVDQGTKVWLDTAIVFETVEPPGLMQASDIATLASQTSFTLAEGSADNDAYNGCVAVITDATTLAQKAHGLISNYVGSSKTVTLVKDPGIFTMAAGDYIDILAASTALTVWDRVLTGAEANVVNSSGRRLRQIQEAGGYSGGAIYVDTVNGTDGTTDFENGVETKPVKSIGDANTLASSLSISKFIISPNSSITFAASQENQEFIGENWDLALGGQSVSNSHITGADVTGTGTSATEVHFEHCEIGAVTLGLFHMDECDISGTVTMSATGTSHILSCYHSGTAIIDFGDTLASSTVHIHDYHGALTISELGSTATDILHFSSADGKLTLDATCIGGTANLNGTFDFVNSGSGITVNQDGQISRASINAEVDTSFVDNFILRRNTAQAGAAGSITLDTGASGVDNFYTFGIVAIISGTGAGQARGIPGYTGSTKVALVEPDWATNPDSTSVFLIIPAGKNGLLENTVNATSIATDAIGSAELATSAVNEIARAINPQQNSAFSNITFEMYDSTNHNPNTGLTVTGERSLDGAAYAGVSGTIAEISDGTYQFDAAGGDMNGALVVFRFSSAGADDTFVHIKTAA